MCSCASPSLGLGASISAICSASSAHNGLGSVRQVPHASILELQLCLCRPTLLPTFPATAVQSMCTACITHRLAPPQQCLAQSPYHPSGCTIRSRYKQPMTQLYIMGDDPPSGHTWRIGRSLCGRSCGPGPSPSASCSRASLSEACLS
jgi:hypothetical protein